MTLPKHVEKFDTSGPIDFYVCELCKGRVSPVYWDDHLKQVHPDKV